MRSARIWTADVSPRSTAAGDGVALALEDRDLLAQLVVAGRDVGDELSELLRPTAPLSPSSAACESQLDHDEEAEQEQRPRSSRARPDGGASGRPGGTALAAGGGRGLGSTRP